jgi:hypothetical protein
VVRTPSILLPLAVALSCAGTQVGSNDGPQPGLTLPVHLAEGSEQDGGAPAAQSGKLAAGKPKNDDLPDPEALKLNRHWEYEVVYDRGTIRIAKVTERRFSKPIPTQRRMGRWAIELWIGHELVDRVRFDFPLLGAEEPRGERRPLKDPPSFAEGAIVSRTVLVPASPRATRAELVDRATGKRQPLPWPPDAPLGPARSSLPQSARHDGGGDAAVD